MSIQNVKAPRGTTIFVLIAVILIIIASIRLIQSVNQKFTSQADITKIKQ